jgi:hypothetical protein
MGLKPKMLFAICMHCHRFSKIKKHNIAHNFLQCEIKNIMIINDIFK